MLRETTARRHQFTLAGYLTPRGISGLAKHVLAIRDAFQVSRQGLQCLQNLVEQERVEADQAIAQSLKPNELAQALRGRG